MKKTYNSPTTKIVVIKTQSILSASEKTYNINGVPEMGSGTFGARRYRYSAWDDDDDYDE